MFTVFPVCVYLFVIGLLGVDGKSGEYFEYYKQSSFEISGSYPNCAITANYSSQGKKLYYFGCTKQSTGYQSQMGVDLDFDELAEICPTLNYLNPSLMPSIPQDGLPPSSQLLFSDSWKDIRCGYSGFSANHDVAFYCPRFRCNHSTTLPTYDTEYDRSIAYYEINTLSFSSITLTLTCHVCVCSPTISGMDWAWDCSDNNVFQGPLYSWNPINNNPSNPYCSKQTLSPTLTPSEITAAPVPQPTATPTTFTPTSSPTAYCVDAWTAAGGPFLSTFLVGDYYFTTDNVVNCTNIGYCYCNDGGVPYCKYGWDQIMGDDLLYYGFLTDSASGCGYGDGPYNTGWGSGVYNFLTECWNDRSASKLFTWYDHSIPVENGPPLCRPDRATLCPRCGCTDTPYIQSAKTNATFTTTTFRKIESESIPMTEWVYTFNCVECDCVLSDSPRGWVSYVPPTECWFYDTENNKIPSDCIYNDLKCYSNSGEYDPKGGKATCSNERINNLYDFNTGCGFMRLTLDTSPDHVCAEVYDEVEGAWGCSLSYECDAIGGPGCYSASFDYDVYQYDCITDEWLKDTYSANMRYSCCQNGFYCNNRTIEDYLDDECTESDQLKTYYQYKKGCKYSQKNVYDITDDKRIIRTAFCGDSLDYYSFALDPNEDGSSYCDILRVYWQYATFCECNEARLNIQRVKNANNGDGMGEDGDKIIEFYKDAFWQNGIYEAGSYTSYTSALYNLFTMYKYWNCSNFESAEDESDTFDKFFTCDFDADTDIIYPTVNPTSNPSANPSANPSSNPSSNPSANPSANPASNPTANPVTYTPTSSPITSVPTEKEPIDESSSLMIASCIISYWYIFIVNCLV